MTIDKNTVELLSRITEQIGVSSMLNDSSKPYDEYEIKKKMLKKEKERLNLSLEEENAIIEKAVRKIAKDTRVTTISCERFYRAMIYAIIVGCFSFLTKGFWVYVALAVIFLAVIRFGYCQSLENKAIEYGIKLAHAKKDTKEHRDYCRELCQMGQEEFKISLKYLYLYDIYHLKWYVEHEDNLLEAKRKADEYLLNLAKGGI